MLRVSSQPCWEGFAKVGGVHGQRRASQRICSAPSPAVLSHWAGFVLEPVLALPWLLWGWGGWSSYRKKSTGTQRPGEWEEKAVRASGWLGQAGEEVFVPWVLKGGAARLPAPPLHESMEVTVHPVLPSKYDMLPCLWLTITPKSSHMPNQLCHQLLLRFYLNTHLLLLCSWKQLSKF